MGDKTGLIVPDDLPAEVLEALTHEQIRQVGYYLFAQLAKQRDHTLEVATHNE